MEFGMPELIFHKVDNNADILMVERLAREIWPDYYIPIIGADQVDYMLTNLQSAVAIHAQIEEGYLYYLIVDAGKSVGYFSVLPRPELKQFFLSKLYLLSAQRGRGLGSRAVIFVEGLAREAGLRKVVLMVSKKNLSSISFYERRGFKIVGPIVKEIGGGFVMDDWSMELDIKPV
jgi:ribosomal protein S18 acetylase RimI-like enzyme